MGKSPALGPEERGVSEVLGYSLIFGLILISITAVSVGGVDSLQSVRDAEQMNNAERAFEVLADNTADIYKRDAPSRATEFSVGAASMYTGTNTTIRIFDTDGSPDKEFIVTPLVFESGDENKIVYEAGAIFRTRRDAGRIVRKPPHDWSVGPPLVTIVATFSRHTESVAGTDILARMKTRERTVPFDARPPPSAGSRSDYMISITSERADLWLRYLKNQPAPSACSKSGNVVTCNIPEFLVVSVHRIEMNLEQ